MFSVLDRNDEETDEIPSDEIPSDKKDISQPTNLLKPKVPPRQHRLNPDCDENKKAYVDLVRSTKVICSLDLLLHCVEYVDRLAAIHGRMHARALSESLLMSLLSRLYEGN